MIEIVNFTFNPFQENTYLLVDEKSKEAFLIDPGCYEDVECQELFDYINANVINLTKIVNTHSHIDHVLGVDKVKEHFKIPFIIHPLDEQTLRMNKIVAGPYGMGKYREPEIDGYIKEGEKLILGETVFEIRFVPGHAPGHIVFINHEQKFVIGGDVLFRQSIGRTDLPGGDHQTLLTSIKEQIYSLPDEYVIHPGHGPETTVGFEKQNNPYCPA